MNQLDFSLNIYLISIYNQRNIPGNFVSTVDNEYSKLRFNEVIAREIGSYEGSIDNLKQRQTISRLSNVVHENSRLS